MFFKSKIEKFEKPKVSILVPCYNVEDFLPQCLESLVSQTLREIEIICINDGSTDGTLAVIQDYARRDPRIVIIDKQNSGYGASMNKGLEIAHGEYIGITESDDFASHTLFKTLYKWAEKENCDLVKANFFEHRSGSDYFMETFAGRAYKTVFDPATDPGIIRCIPSVWAAIYRREMLNDHKVRFNETPGASFQDTAFVMKGWFCAKRALLLPKAYLHYRVDNPNSSVKSTTKIFSVCDEFEATYSFMDGDPDRKRLFINAFVSHMFNTYRWNYNRIADGFHAAFADRMEEDMCLVKKNNELFNVEFTEENWRLLQELLKDKEQFLNEHPSDF